MVNDELNSGWNMRINGDEKRDTAMSMQEKRILGKQLLPKLWMQDGFGGLTDG